MLSCIDLSVRVGKKQVLDAISVEFKRGQVTYILGPNGAGKSALIHTIMGSPIFKVSAGKIVVENQDITELKPYERSRLGIFVSWQEPVAIPGLKTFDFLYHSYISTHKGLSKQEFREKVLNPLVKRLKIKHALLDRDLYMGFSGGEKKRVEVLSMFLLEPKYIFLDELDSGLDVDAEKELFTQIYSYAKKNSAALVVVSHTFRVHNYIPADRAYVLKHGRLAASGGKELVKKVEKQGFGGV